MKLRLASPGLALLLATSGPAAQTRVPRIALLPFQASPESLLTAATDIAAAVRARMLANTGLVLLPGPPLDATQQDSLRAAVRRETLQGPIFFVTGLLTTRPDGRVELILKAQDVRLDNVVAGQRIAAPAVKVLDANPDSLVAQILRGIATTRARRRG